MALTPLHGPNSAYFGKSTQKTQNQKPNHNQVFLYGTLHAASHGSPYVIVAHSMGVGSTQKYTYYT